MRNLFRIAYESLADTVFRCAAVPVIYTRRDGTAIACSAVHGHTEVRTPSADGVYIEATAHDFLFRRNDIDFTPQRGDTITTATRTYEVAALGNSSHWQFSTPDTIRIHCK